MKELNHILEFYKKHSTRDVDMAIASVVSVNGSSYRRIGARMIVTSDGQWTGGISGGCLEGDALDRSRRAIAMNESSIITYDTGDEDSNAVGVSLGCNGIIKVLFSPLSGHGNVELEKLTAISGSRDIQILCKVIKSTSSEFSLGQIVEANQIALEGFSDLYDQSISTQRSSIFENEDVQILIEVIKPSIRLVIFGDSYDLYSMANMATELSWKVEVYCHLRKILDRFNSPVSLLPRDKISDLSIDDFTAIVLMTHDLNWDKVVLPVLDKLPYQYIGVLGPTSRWDRLIEELAEEGVTLSENLQDSVYNPIGLDIGAEGPDEIAVSIISEIIAFFRDREGGFLKDRLGPIH